MRKINDEMNFNFFRLIFLTFHEPLFFFMENSSSQANLFIFDFDETLSVRASCYPIEELAPNTEKLNLNDIDHRYEKIHHCWNKRMNEVHERLSEQGVHTKQILEVCRTIELSPGTEKLFYDINSNNSKIIMLSNACDLVVEECLRAQNLLQYIDKIESNPVQQLYPIMIIDEYEKPLQTECTICDPNLCKGLVIEKYRDRKLYDKIIFIGDGDNDVCAALHLNKTDYVFAKYDETSGKVYKMYDMLKNQYFHQLKSEMFSWKTMNDVHDKLKKKNIL
jgi:pyridoxal phosphate phosphatase PHOSPHO2